MSNEYKDWLFDKLSEVVLDRNLADIITHVYPPFVYGSKNGDRVRFEVWYDQGLEEWRCERRELNNAQL